MLGFNKKSTATDPELEAAVRERWDQDLAHRDLHKAAEIEHWDRIRERVEL